VKWRKKEVGLEDLQRCLPTSATPQFTLAASSHWMAASERGRGWIDRLLLCHNEPQEKEVGKAALCLNKLVLLRKPLELSHSYLLANLDLPF